MASLSLKISIVEKMVTKTMQFEPATSVYDACRIIREKITEANLGQPKDYGLFLADEDIKKGVWLEPGRSLNYYILKGGELLEYKKKLRQLRVRMLDGTLKTMLVDDSQPVANLMVVICTKIGLTNHDEYSLVRETFEDEMENKPGNYGTLTLKRRKEEGRERDAKMEQLRKKLKTDDEVNWVDPSKTLREQGVDEAETVLLRRKFFFSDQNIDSRDPVQLNLLYVQARDAILDGTHPVTLDKACEFAGIQCQIQFGDHVESKHKTGFLDLKEFLPQSYIKVKGVEKKVFAEHRKHLGVSELDSKVTYTKIARSLKTYGVTFFLVKEKMKGKNKLVPRLLGVTKDSVLRLDERTKEILKTWPLTTVRRWGASPNTFTLDFGDYSDQYYSVQTTEAEQILQLISGYIDIILKKKQSKDHFGIEGDEGSTMVEDSVSPYKATILQHETSKVGKVNTESLAKPAIMRAGADGARPYGTGHMGGAQFTTVSGQANVAHTPPPMVQQQKVTMVLTEPQRALIGTISAGHQAISAAEQELSTRAQLPKLGTDPASLKWKETTLDTNKQSVSSQIAAMNAATAQVVTLTSGPSEAVDHNAVGAAISAITSNLPEMTRGVRMIAALMDDDPNGDRLLDAARRLCTAFSDMLTAAEPEAKEPRQSLLNAAGRVGEASHAVLSSIGEEDENSRELQEMLLGLAKAVANTTAALVLKAKNIAAACDDQPTQNQVIGAATQCALATSQLVACAKVVAPTLHNAACQEQLVGAVREVARAVEHLVAVCQEAGADENLMRELNQAVAEVTRSLNDLLNHIKHGVNERGRESVQESAVETIMITTDRLLAVSGDSGEMVRQARILGRATAQLIQAIKGEAEQQQDSELQRRLLSAAKTLADATARMVEAARLCASSPHEVTHQDSLRHAAEEIRAATSAAATPAMRARTITRLENAARQVASCTTQTLAAAQGSLPHNTNQVAHQQLLADCRSVAEHVPRLVEGVKGTMARPHDPECQLTLIEISESFLQPGNRVVQSSRGALPTVADQASAMALGQSSQQLSSSLSDLRSAAVRAREACGPGLELESAERLVAELREELAAFEKAAQQAQLRPLPGDTADQAALQLGGSAQNVVASMAKLTSAAAQGNESYTGREARATAAALGDFTRSVRSVAATTTDRAMQTKIIISAEEVMERSLHYMDEARRVVSQGPEHNNVQQLSQSAKRVQQSIENCVGCLPSQKDVDEAISTISDASQILNMGEFPPTDKSYGQLQQELNSAAAHLNDASTGVAASVRSPGELAASSKRFGAAFGDLLGVSMEMAGQTKDTETRGQMVVSLKNVSMVSSSLLVTAKSVAADPTAPNAKNRLAGAARAVTDSINYLVDVCTSAAPGQKECDNALRNIQAMKPLLDNPSEPVSEATYFECLDSVMEKSKSLGDGMTGIANHAKKGQHEQFSSSVRGASAAICGLVEAAAQAAYLVGVSDPSSVAGRPGIVDQAMLNRAAQAISTACQGLSNPASTQQQVLSAATVIAKHTSALCNACRIASAQTHNPVAKRHFVQSAKDVANSTASLVKEIKALDRDYSAANRDRCSQATRPLLEAVDSLCMFASSSEFASVPGRISDEARRSQQPITGAGRSIIDGSCEMIRAAKSLAVNPRDPPTWQVLANHSKSVSDSIKKLVSSIRDKAPGQRECDLAIERLNAKIRDLDQASLEAVSQSLHPRRDLTAQGYSEQTEASASEILDRLEPLRTAAKYEAEKIGHAVNQMAQYVEPLVGGAVGAASNMTHSKQQMVLLDQAKTVVESALQLVYATKEGGGNPKAVNIHPDIDEACEATREALQDLGGTLERLATQAGVVTGIVDAISRAMARVTDRRLTRMETTSLSFVDYQTRMVAAAKELARLAQEMVSKAGSADASRLAPLGAELSRQYAQLAADAGGAASATSNPDVAQRLTGGVHELGQACVDLVKAGGACHMGPAGDAFAQREVAEAGRTVSEKVSQVLAALQAGSRGTQACINAASTVSGIIGDLDTTIMFATAGTLHAEGEGESFADHREHILKTAKALVEDTKTLVAGAASSQEQLAVAAQNAVSTIVQLAEVVKFGAASLGANNPESQVMLINAVKDVASALGDLIQATKAASGKSITDPSMNHLKESAKVMVTNVTSLLKTVKAVEDEHSRGTRALEATIEAIAQEIRALQSHEQPRTRAAPEDLVRCAKPITQATAKAVAAGNSGKQDDIIVAANMGRKAISDMLTTCKSAAHGAENADLQQRTLQSGHSVATMYRELLQTVLMVLERPGASAEVKQNMAPVSRRIAQSVTELVAAAEMLKGTDHEDPDDPTVIAENELLGAAASIDAAAKKLASLRPRRSIQEADESLNFDEMILEAAKSIAAATSALVKAASAAQRELIDLGKVSRRPLFSSDDGQWSEGLVSAARLVAAATHSLVESANGLVQGVSGEEKLVSAAKQVASSTAQLLVACKVKADPDSASTKRLQAAGNAVKRATDNLVRAAQQAAAQEEERSLVLNRRMVGGMAQEINARSEVLRIERQLEEARGRLTAVRQARYKRQGPGSGGEDTGDEGGYGSGYESFTSRYETRTFDPNASGTSPSQQMYASSTNNASATSPSQQMYSSASLRSTFETSPGQQMFSSTPQRPQTSQPSPGQQMFTSSPQRPQSSQPSPAHAPPANNTHSQNNGGLSTFGTPTRPVSHMTAKENSTNQSFQQSSDSQSMMSSSSQRLGSQTTEESMMSMLQKSSQRIERSVTTVTQQRQSQLSSFRSINQQHQQGQS